MISKIDIVPLNRIDPYRSILFLWFSALPLTLHWLVLSNLFIFTLYLDLLSLYFGLTSPTLLLLPWLNLFSLLPWLDHSSPSLLPWLFFFSFAATL